MRGAVQALRYIHGTLQKTTELGNNSTRPYGWQWLRTQVAETERNARVIERSFTFLANTEAVYREWLRIVVQYGVSGVQIHDARLAAASAAECLCSGL
jgi:hypothetical protein